MSTSPKPLTPAQRAHKIAEAKTCVARALRLLDDVANDFDRRAFELSTEERAEWAQVVHAAANLDRLSL